jgi:hypothetical protein
MTDFKTAQSLATQAYIKVWREQGLLFCPPVGISTRDKHWSKRLREAWPEMTTVDIKPTDGFAISQMKTWCMDKGSSFWHNGNGSRWYFEKPDIAVLFKLTFGGAQ